MAKLPYKINEKKKRKEKESERDVGEEQEAVGVVTGWWVNKYLNFMPGYLGNHEIIRYLIKFS